MNHCQTHNWPILLVQVIEKVTPNHPQHRLEREDFWIKKMNTKTPKGPNKND
jgi:hypothetical protein